jgi:hypothetical protein
MRKKREFIENTAYPVTPRTNDRIRVFECNVGRKTRACKDICVNSRLWGNPVFPINDYELIEGSAPIPNRHCPFFGNIFQLDLTPKAREHLAACAQ